MGNNEGISALIVLWVITVIASIVIAVKVPVVNNSKADQYRRTAIILGLLPCSIISIAGQIIALVMRGALVANQNRRQGQLQGRFTATSFNEGSTSGTAQPSRPASSGNAFETGSGGSSGTTPSANPFDD